MKVTVVGGGIAGLASTYFVLRHATSANLPVSCTLIESTQRFGGKVRTELTDGFVIEDGPDSFLSYKPWGIQLCRELGLMIGLLVQILNIIERISSITDNSDSSPKG